MGKFKFDDMESIKRNRDLEKEGQPVFLAGDRVLIVRAASDANPAWAAQSDDFNRELMALRDAGASRKRIREFTARKMADLLVVDWRGVKSGGVELPFSAEACFEFLCESDDAFDQVDGTAWNTKNYRIRRVEAAVNEAKN
ncbi:MAG: hypothetical protein U1E23_09585 [Reyranellaceae bacterium]